MDLPVAIGNGSNEWGVFGDFPLCNCFLETAMEVIEFNVVEFDVGITLYGKGLVGLEAFYEKNVFPKTRHANAWGRKANVGE